MEHIRQYDWCSPQSERYYLDERDIDNCAIEKIIRNKFYDPMASSDSEDETPKQKIDWSDVFVMQDDLGSRQRMYIAGLRAPPRFPKLSALTKQQHYTVLKIICAENPDVLSLEYMARVNKSDQKVYQAVKDTYLKEQQEFMAWAKTLWISKHCLNALRPKPTIEMVYEAEFKMKAAELGSYPKTFEMAAQVPLEKPGHKCDMILKQDLINVSLLNIPKVQIPELAMKRFQILRPCPVPEPCDKHPCQFVLPNEKNTTVLPLTEIHRELAQYALDNGAKCIASEKALKCLLETDRHWTLPLSVCQCVNADGGKENVLVFGSEFSIRKKCARSRTYIAYRHLLEYALLLQSDKMKIMKRLHGEERPENENPDLASLFEETMTTDDDRGNLVIKTDKNKMAVQSDSETEDELVIDETRSEQSCTNNGKPPLSPGDIEIPRYPKRHDTSRNQEINETPQSQEIINETSRYPRRNRTPLSSTKVETPQSSSGNETPRYPRRHETPQGFLSQTPRQSPRRSNSSEENNREDKMNGSKTSESPSPQKNIPLKRSNYSEEKNCDDDIGGPMTSDCKKKKKSDFYSCSCKDSSFERPPQRSFRRWQVRNFADSDSINAIDLIVHCSHKMKTQTGEVIAEPIPEYQIELAGSQQSDQKIKSLALSLHLRKNATLLNMRVDSATGDVVTVDKISKDEFMMKHINIMNTVANVLYESINQLQGLVPGHYVLQHESIHGANALIYASRAVGSSNKLTLDFNMHLLTEADEAKSVKSPPVLAPVLLPMHKHRKMLPCAFTPYENMVLKETKKPPPPPKPKPPRALQVTTRTTLILVHYNICSYIL